MGGVLSRLSSSSSPTLPSSSSPSLSPSPSASSSSSSSISPLTPKQQKNNEAARAKAAKNKWFRRPPVHDVSSSAPSQVNANTSVNGVTLHVLPNGYSSNQFNLNINAITSNNSIASVPPSPLNSNRITQDPTPAPSIPNKSSSPSPFPPEESVLLSPHTPHTNNNNTNIVSAYNNNFITGMDTSGKGSLCVVTPTTNNTHRTTPSPFPWFPNNDGTDHHDDQTSLEEIEESELDYEQNDIHHHHDHHHDLHFIPQKTTKNSRNSNNKIVSPLPLAPNTAANASSSTASSFSCHLKSPSSVIPSVRELTPTLITPLPSSRSANDTIVNPITQSLPPSLLQRQIYGNINVNNNNNSTIPPSPSGFFSSHGLTTLDDGYYDEGEGRNSIKRFRGHEDQKNIIHTHGSNYTAPSTPPIHHLQNSAYRSSRSSSPVPSPTHPMRNISSTGNSSHLLIPSGSSSSSTGSPSSNASTVPPSKTPSPSSLLPIPSPSTPKSSAPSPLIPCLTPPTPTPLPLIVNYRKGELLGFGAHGQVFLALNSDNGQLFAVKEVPIMSGASKRGDKIIAALESEIQLMSSLSHPNIVRYLGTQRTTNTLNIFLEFVPGGSISSLLKRFGKFNEVLVRLYVMQILMGLEYLHSQGLIHRDIKGGNILVDNQSVIKLTDFGAATRLADLSGEGQSGGGAKGQKSPYPNENPKTAGGGAGGWDGNMNSPPQDETQNDHPEVPPLRPHHHSHSSESHSDEYGGQMSMKGTVVFMAPEVIKQTGHGRQADVWSCGITTMEMATGRTPWPQFNSPFALMMHIAMTEDLPALPDDMSLELKHFICCCLQRDPKKRPTAKRLLTHPFITKKSLWEIDHNVLKISGFKYDKDDYGEIPGVESTSTDGDEGEYSGERNSVNNRNTPIHPNQYSHSNSNINSQHSNSHSHSGNTEDYHAEGVIKVRSGTPSLSPQQIVDPTPHPLPTESASSSMEPLSSLPPNPLIIDVDPPTPLAPSTVISPHAPLSSSVSPSPKGGNNNNNKVYVIRREHSVRRDRSSVEFSVENHIVSSPSNSEGNGNEAENNTNNVEENNSGVDCIVSAALPSPYYLPAEPLPVSPFPSSSFSSSPSLPSNSVAPYPCPSPSTPTNRAAGKVDRTVNESTLSSIHSDQRMINEELSRWERENAKNNNVKVTRSGETEESRNKSSLIHHSKSHSYSQSQSTSKIIYPYSGNHKKYYNTAASAFTKTIPNSQNSASTSAPTRKNINLGLILPADIPTLPIVPIPAISPSSGDGHDNGITPLSARGADISQIISFLSESYNEKSLYHTFRENYGEGEGEGYDEGKGGMERQMEFEEEEEEEEQENGQSNDYDKVHSIDHPHQQGLPSSSSSSSPRINVNLNTTTNLQSSSSSPSPSYQIKNNMKFLFKKTSNVVKPQ